MKDIDYTQPMDEDTALKVLQVVDALRKLSGILEDLGVDHVFSLGIKTIGVSGETWKWGFLCSTLKAMQQEAERAGDKLAAERAGDTLIDARHNAVPYVEEIMKVLGHYVTMTTAGQKPADG